MRRSGFWKAATALLVAGWAACAQAQVGAGTAGTILQRQPAGLRGDALVQYDPETGSLIVVTDEETNEQIRQVVEEMDRPVPQVLIKVLFLEVTHSNDLDLGVEGFIQETDSYNFSNRVDIERIETVFGLINQTTGGFYRIIEDDLNLTIAALAQVSKLEVLSRPSVLTRNNREAIITVGQEVPFIRNSRVTDTGQIINTVEYEDIGIILRVTPHITEDGLVALDVFPEISTLTGETVPISGQAEAPIFAKRSAETSVVVPDGSTVVIGGLMEDNTTQVTRKVPLLGDIPLLGLAFRRKIDTKTKTELLIFLTPRIVQGSSQLEQMTISERSRSRLMPKAFDDEEVDRYISAPEVRIYPPPEEIYLEEGAYSEEAIPEQPAFSDDGPFVAPADSPLPEGAEDLGEYRLRR